uniref:NADH-ubiquinone oxidoreductase chain 4L n=1 Tax=Coleolaelaps cf. liui XFX-2019 TaxID=2695870 RepID=A0A6B9WH73_9ACAR|nr:NADH dehydrogenase subunit 4L [Coleolaelaps cf. liui XFX-2019]
MKVIFEMGLFVFVVGMVSFVKHQKHVLMMLLSMEMMMVGIYFFMVMFLVSEMYEMFIMFLVMVVCEAMLGLSLMVNMVSYYGSDLIMSYSFVEL